MVTTEQVARLEASVARTNRLFRFVSAIAGGLLFWCVALQLGRAGPAIAQTGAQSVEEVRARKFVLEDERGELRAALFMAPEGATFQIVDENQVTRIGLHVTKDGPMLAMRDGKGIARVALGSNQDGSALVITDEAKAPSIALGLLKGESSLVFSDPTHPRLSMGLTARSMGEMPNLTLTDQAGHIRASFCVTAQGPMLFLKDGEEKNRFGFMAREGGAVLQLFGDTGKLVDLNVSDNTASMRIYDSLGGIKWTVP